MVVKRTVSVDTMLEDESLPFLLVDAMLNPGKFTKRVISDVSEKSVADLLPRGVIVDVTWKHTIDNSAVRHTIKMHGSEKESLRGQIPIAEADLLSIPDIVQNYNAISIEKNRREQDVIIYSKEKADGITYYYVEEVRQGRRELAASTMYKRKKENSPTQMG